MSKDQIIQALDSPQEEVRLQGLKALAEADPQSSLDLVFTSFGDESWRVRKEAIDLFLRLPVSRELIGEIIELLHAEENAGLRNAAVEILTRMGRDAVPMLVDQARCPDHDVRKFIIDVLGDIADEQAVGVLIEGLTDEDSNVRAAAAENLGKLKVVSAVPALLDAMQNPDLLLRFTILDALSRIGSPIPYDRLVSFRDEKLLRKALVDCLGKVGDASAADELVISLTDSMRNVREAAVTAFVSLAERHKQESLAALSGHDPARTADAVTQYLGEDHSDTLRSAAARILGWLGPPDAVLPLLELLDSEPLQKSAMLALVDIGEASQGTLIDAWGRVPKERLAYLAYILGESFCTDAVELLHTALSSEDPQLQQMSAYALGRLGSPVVLPALVTCLRQSEGDVQKAATQALVNLGGKFATEALDALQPLLSDQDPVLRAHAVTVIGRLDGADILDVLTMALKDASADVRRAAVRSFEGRDVEEYLGAILLTLTDEDVEVRRTVVEILGASGCEQAVDGLQLALEDEDIWVRASAVRNLGRLGAADGQSFIRRAINDPVGLVSIAALETLEGLLGEAACPDLVNALSHSDEEVVTAAINLLSRHSSGDWLPDNAEDLINHPFWAVRSQFARLAADMLGAEARGLLETRLNQETEDLVRQQIHELLERLPTD